MVDGSDQVAWWRRIVPRAWRDRIALIAAFLASVGVGVSLLRLGAGSFDGRVAVIVIAMVLGFILGNVYEVPIAHLIIRPMSRWWTAVLSFLAWWTGQLIAVVALIEWFIRPGREAFPALTVLGTGALLAVLMAVSVPFFPRTSMITGSYTGDDAFQKLGIRGLRYWVIKILGAMTLLAAIPFVIMGMIAALLEPDFNW